MIESLQKLKERALTFPEMASSIIVHDAKSLKGANDFLLGVKGMIKEIKESFSTSKKKTHEAHKAVVAQEQSILEAPLAAEKAVKMQIGVYVRKIEDERREAERKAYLAEQERLRKQAEIEAEAQRFANHGHHREADEIREQYVEPEIVEVPDAPSLNGISVSKILTFEITDEEKVPRRFLSVDKVKIRAYIRYEKECRAKTGKKEIEIPGIRIYYEDSVRASRGE